MRLNAKAKAAADAEKKKRRKSKYLVCVDAYEYSVMALRFACSVAKNNGCPVELIHVLAPIDFKTFHAVADKMRDENRQKAEKLLEGYCEEAHRWAGVTPSLNIREGEIEEEIVSAVEEDSSINMLVLGTSPDSGNRSKLLTELVSKLHDRLVIPMLIVPGNITEHQINELT